MLLLLFSAPVFQKRGFPRAARGFLLFFFCIIRRAPPPPARAGKCRLFRYCQATAFGTGSDDPKGMAEACCRVPDLACLVVLVLLAPLDVPPLPPGFAALAERLALDVGLAEPWAAAVRVDFDDT